MAELNNKIYKFRVIGNYDVSALGSLGTALDNSKTQFLICEDVMEADDPEHARHGFRYLVARPRYLWNAYSPKLYTGSVYDGETPIRPNYSEDDLIEAISVFDDTVYEPLELDYSSDLKSYIGTFNTSDNPLMNWSEINDSSIIRCYFIDSNRDARTRELGGGGSTTCIPTVVASPNLFPPPGTKTAIVENSYLGINHAMFCLESTEILFQDTIQVNVKEKNTLIEIPKEFLAICDRFYVSSLTASEPVSVGCSILNDFIIVKLKEDGPVDLVITLTGTRKGYNNKKYSPVSDEVKNKNFEFWTSWNKD